MTNNTEALFKWVLAICISPLVKCFKNWAYSLNDLWYWYILDISPLSDICFIKLSLPVVCLFIFLPVYFKGQKLQILIEFKLLIFFPFMMCTFYVSFQRILCLTHHYEDFLLYSLLEILALMFRTMIHFEVILYKKCDKVEVLFIVLRYPIFPWYLCWKSNDCFVWVHF